MLFEFTTFELGEILRAKGPTQYDKLARLYGVLVDEMEYNDVMTETVNLIDVFWLS